MSTIASPRPSFASSSRRNSNSTDITVTTVTSNAPRSAPSAAERAALRRNRAALRDYYNLKDSNNSEEDKGNLASNNDAAADDDENSEFDRPGFDPAAHVETLLAHSGLEKIIRTAAGLTAEIRALDGEKKALVYDNYSKLIAATDTIRSMREKMDPLTPTTRTLTPAVGHIAETAVQLSALLKEMYGGGGAAAEGEKEGVEEDVGTQRVRQQQRETVRWVLAAPTRLAEQMAMGRESEAEEEWQQISQILERWNGVKGVEEVQAACLSALGKKPR